MYTINNYDRKDFERKSMFVCVLTEIKNYWYKELFLLPGRVLYISVSLYFYISCISFQKEYLVLITI